MLSINATIFFLFLYLVNNKIWILGCRKISVVIYLIIILLFTFICLKSRIILKKSCVEGDIIELSLANDTYMADYLGYFFVALGLPNDWLVFWVVYLIVFLFTYKSQSLYYNPLFLLFGYNFYHIRDKEGMKVFIISKKKDIRTCENLSFNRMRKINNFTFIDEEK